MAAIVTTTVATKTNIPRICTMFSRVIFSYSSCANVPSSSRVLQYLVELFAEAFFVLRVVAVLHEPYLTVADQE